MMEELRVCHAKLKEDDTNQKDMDPTPKIGHNCGCLLISLAIVIFNDVYGKLN